MTGHTDDLSVIIEREDSWIKDIRREIHAGDSIRAAYVDTVVNNSDRLGAATGHRALTVWRDIDLGRSPATDSDTVCTDERDVIEVCACRPPEAILDYDRIEDDTIRIMVDLRPVRPVFFKPPNIAVFTECEGIRIDNIGNIPERNNPKDTGSDGCT